MHILENHDREIKQNAQTSMASTAQDDLEKFAKTSRGTVSSAATPSAVAAVTDTKRASSIEGGPSSPTLFSQRRPPYLAAGVLPFCVIGGDLLFLLGQQLRFCSRGHGASFSESDCDSAAAGGADGVEASPERVPGDSSPPPPLTPPSSSSIDDGAADASTSMMHSPQPCRPESTEVKRKEVNAPSAATTSPGVVMSPAATPGECWRGSAPDSVPAGLLWSDFGGGREAGDADVEETASREFAEESFGLFNGVRLQSDSVARSQAAMEVALRDPTLRGKRVFECRNGSYVMFIAEVDFVPDIMMKLARKEIMDSGEREGGNSGGCRGGRGKASSPGFSEKTDFAWVPATSLLKAMRESRHRSTRRVVVKLGDCRYLRLFHKFVISLWRLDLAAVIRAALTPLPQRNKTPFSAPRILLLKHAATHDGNENRMVAFTRGGDRETNSSIKGSTKYAIRGIDCVRPSFLSGRKQTSLGIIDPSCELLRPRPSRRSISDSNSSRMSEETGSDREAGAETGSASIGEDGEGNRSHLRSRRSGAACRKRRRQRKEARRLKAVAAAAATTQAAPEKHTHAL